MRGLVLVVLVLLPVTGLLGSWTDSRPRVPIRVQRTYTGAVHGRLGAEHTADSEPAAVLVADVLKLFQGEFDNYDQVVEDRMAGLLPGPGGGHEHIHCSLKVLDPSQVPDQVATGGRSAGGVGARGEEVNGEEAGSHDLPMAVVAAKYYFNGEPNVVFRYRLYSFHACPPNARGARGDAVMRLWRLLPPVESRLRAAGYDLTSFNWCGGESGRAAEGDNDRLAAAAAGGGRGGGGRGGNSESGMVAEHIVGCEIYWSRHGADAHDSESVRGARGVPAEGQGEAQDGGDKFGAVGDCSGGDARLTDAATTTSAAVPTGASFVGLMGEDDSGTWISSQNVAGLDILVKDDLRLWADQLWVNDRGFDRGGNFVYGNQRSVPYKMRRVPASGGGPLGWTLGEQHRTKDTYAEKMAAIGVTPGQRFGPPPPPSSKPQNARRRSAGSAPAKEGG